MKIRGHYARLLLVTLLTLLLNGCWDNREPRRLAYVLSMAIDQAERQPNRLQVTLQIPVPKKLSGEKGGKGGADEYALVQGTGATLVTAMQDAQERISRELFFGQMRSIIASSRLSPDQVHQLTDEIRRNPQLEETVYLTIARARAVDLLGVKSPQEELPALYFNNVYRSVPRGTVSFPVQGWEFWRIHKEPGWHPVVPVAEVVGTQMIRVAGLAVYRNDQFRGFLEREEAQGFLWLTGRTRDRAVAVTVPEGAAEVRGLAGSRSIKVRFENSLPVFHIRVRAQGELSLSPWPTVKEEQISRMEAEVATVIRGQIQAALTKIQGEYQSDILGLGNLLYYRHPTYFDRVDWDGLFPQIRIESDVQVSITRKGLLN